MVITFPELLGYVASILVAVSLMMRSLLRLRLINLAGATAFTLYGLLIEAYPVAAVNFFIVLIDVYFLYQMFRAQEHFSVAEVRPTSDYLHQFLKYYGADIRRFQPEFKHEAARPQNVYFILRDMVPAGLFILEPHAAGTAHIALDFVTPQYRDFQVGDFLFRRSPQIFQKNGVHTLVSPPGSPEHERYLQKLGFVRAGETYQRQVGAG
jgi:hypothetical protein